MNSETEWTEKAWGKTKSIFQDHSSEVHLLHIKAGGFSSKHRHRKWNRFCLISGELAIEQYIPKAVGEAITINNLQIGIPYDIAPNCWHRFRAKTDCQVVEIYWVDRIDPADIERADVGGLEVESKLKSIPMDITRLNNVDTLIARSHEFELTTVCRKFYPKEQADGMSLEWLIKAHRAIEFGDSLIVFRDDHKDDCSLEIISAAWAMAEFENRMKVKYAS